jgi:DNA-binding transcriptional LysR family regulator
MNFLTLDLNLLRVFDFVMVERNVTRAAARLAMTQPAVSNALRRLREAIGEELFVPGPAGVTPTPQAQALWPSVRSAMDALRLQFDPQDFDARHDPRTFMVAMADATSVVLLPGILHALETQTSRVELRVLPLTTRDPRPLLEQGFIDLALGFFPEPAAAVAAAGGSSPIAMDRLYECEYVCVMRRDHPLASQDALTLDAYCCAHHLRVNFSGRPHGFVDEALARLGRERRVRLTVNEFSTAAGVVYRSDLITVLPISFVRASGFVNEFAVRPFPGVLPRIEVAMLWHRRHHRDAGHSWLRHTISRTAKQCGLPPSGGAEMGALIATPKTGAESQDPSK